MQQMSATKQLFNAIVSSPVVQSHLLITVSAPTVPLLPSVADDFCDPQEETQTEQFAILWKEEPYDVEDFFKDKDIKLEWSADWDWDEENIWTVYEAKTVKAANGIMRDIQRVIDGEGMSTCCAVGSAVDARVLLDYHGQLWASFIETAAAL